MQNEELSALILESDDIEYEDLFIREWGPEGVTVRVKTLDADTRSQLLVKAMDTETGEVFFPRIYGDLAVLSVYNPETDERIFTLDQKAALMAKSSSPVERIVMTAMILSKFDQDALDEAGKDSSDTPNGGSSTS